MKLHALIHEAKRDLYGMWMVRVWVGALDGICLCLWFFGRAVRSVVWVLVEHLQPTMFEFVHVRVSSITSEIV